MHFPGLASEAIYQRRLLWKIRPKLHKWLGLFGFTDLWTWTSSLWLRLDHICLDQAPILNPLFTSCYGDEDMVSWACKCFLGSTHSTLQEIWHTCMHITQVGKIKQFAMTAHPHLLGRQVIRRYVAYVCVRWLRRLSKWYDNRWSTHTLTAKSLKFVVAIGVILTIPTTQLATRPVP